MANIIAPCCTERELGSILREAGGRAAMFQTQGDVTLEAFVKATMLMAGDRPRTLTIATPVLPENAMRTIRRYAELGYISTLRLMLSERPEAGVLGGSLTKDQSVALQLPAEVQLAITEKVPSLMIWQGATGIVAIQGDMPDVVEPTLHLYAGIMGGLQSLNVHAAIDPFDALFRARKVELVAVPQQQTEQVEQIEQRTTADEHGQAEQGEQRTTADSTDAVSVVAGSPSDNQPSETKKTRKTKKTKDDEEGHE